MSVRLAVFALVSLGFAGCIKQTQRRLAPVRGTPVEALARIDADAKRAGLTRLETPRDAGWFERWAASYYAEKADVDKQGQRTTRELDVKTHEVDATTTVVELSSTITKDRFNLTTILPTGHTYVNWHGPLERRLAYDVVAEIGAGSGPRGASTRLDAIGRLGYRFLFGEPNGLEPEARYGLGVLAGAGYVIESRDRRAWRADVTLLGSVQEIAEPAPGWLISSIPVSLGLTVAYLRGLDDHGQAVELELAADVTTLVGLFARVGHEWDIPGERSGMTYSAGLKAGPRGAMYAVGFAGLLLGLGLVYFYGVTASIPDERQ